MIKFLMELLGYKTLEYKPPLLMTEAEDGIIRRFASGDESFRDLAIIAHTAFMRRLRSMASLDYYNG